MKILSVIPVFFMAYLFSPANAQPGKYANASLKQLLHVDFTDERSISELDGYELTEWILLNHLDDPERLFLNIYSKGNTRVLLFTGLKDTALNIFSVLDVLEVKNVAPGLEFIYVTCRQQKVENAEIVALVFPREQEYFIDIKKAWICDRSKRQFRWIPIKGIDCLNEGYEQF